MRRLRSVLLALLAVSCGLFGLALAAPPARADSSTVTITGHGFGHGRGMGQWGSFGYATKPDLQWGYGQILDHFYGGAGLANPGFLNLTVRLTANDGNETIVYQPNGAFTVNGTPAGGAAVRVQRVGTNTFQVYDGPSCGGPWTARAGTIGGTVTVHNVSGSGAIADLLQLCQIGKTTSYRDDLQAADSGGAQATVNSVMAEHYTYGVVPRESPASWGDAAGGKGMEALKAQAVAARSYGLSEQRWSFAQTCDTTSCQVYGGAATNSGGKTTVLEDPRSNAAVDATAAFVLKLNGSNAIARTEFSSSTGGFTAGGTFPAVPDDGDDVSGNPNHNWTRTFTNDTLSANLGVGTVTGISVTQRDGNGADGGRALKVTVQTTSGPTTLSGFTVQSRLGLPSNWFSFGDLVPADNGAPAAGGYRVDGNGVLTPFGSAPAASVTGVSTGAAHAVAVGGPSRTSGVVLTGDGTLHPFGGGSAGTGGMHWTGVDAARDVVLRKDGSPGYLLDFNGGVYGFAGEANPPISKFRSTGADPFAVRLVLRSDGVSGYVLFADGSVGTFGAAPAVGGVALPAGRSAVGIVLEPDDHSVAVIDDGGGITRTGGAVLRNTGTAGTVRSAAGRRDGSAYELTSSGAVTATLGAPDASGAAAPGAVDIGLVPELAGYTLDFSGGLHPFGGAPQANVTAYWNGWDIARGVAVGPRGAGWVLDGWGGLHPFGTDGAAPPVANTSNAAFWNGWDIARGIALIPGRDDAGYVLDGWGGVHPFGPAPAVRITAYWSGWDIARAIVMLPNGTGGYVLDGWGGIHPFAVGSNAMPSTPSGAPYWSGWDIARGIFVSDSSHGMVLDGWGGVHGMGQVNHTSFVWPGHDTATGLVGDPNTGWAVWAQRSGELHTVDATPTPTSAPGSTWGFSAVRGAATIPNVPSG